MSITYERDLILWAKATAQLLREQRWEAIDLPHLIEEVEDLGKSERSAIGSQMERITSRSGSSSTLTISQMIAALIIK